MVYLVGSLGSPANTQRHRAAPRFRTFATVHLHFFTLTFRHFASTHLHFHTSALSQLRSSALPHCCTRTFAYALIPLACPRLCTYTIGVPTLMHLYHGRAHAYAFIPWACPRLCIYTMGVPTLPHLRTSLIRSFAVALFADSHLRTYLNNV
jgi:hypothetical protein